MNKILVTGGTGYIGSHTIIEILENTNWKVISADNYSNSSAKTLHRIKNITGAEIQNYPVDLCDTNAVKNIFLQNPDITGIIHFAAFKSVSESVEKPLLYYHNNITSLLNMLAAVKEHNIPFFIFSSSCSVYGNIDKLPVSEKTPLNPVSPYGFTKLAGERLVHDFTFSHPAAKAISLRYFNPAGAHLSGKIGEQSLLPPSNLVPVITQTAIGKRNETTVFGNDYNTRDGTCIRDYIHVSDIARAHIEALAWLENNSNAPHSSIFNLGSGSGVSVMEMIRTFEKVSNRKLNYRIGSRRPGDVEAIYSDSSFATQTFGWKPKYTLDDMMLSAWKWEQAMSNGQ